VVREVATLKHEVRDDTVEARTLVVQRLSRFPDAFLSRAESTEVFCGLRNLVGVELPEMKIQEEFFTKIDCSMTHPNPPLGKTYLKLNAASWLSADVNIKKHVGAAGHLTN
jgi:hypothetical protein